MKMLDATCAGGVVTAEGVPVPAAEILSEGAGPSSGVLVIDKDLAKYLTSNAADLKATLQQVSAALAEVTSALETLAGKNYLVAATAGVPDPTAAVSWLGNITALTAAKAQIDVLTETLK